MTSSPSPFREDGAQFAWDSTSLSLAQACLRKYQLKMIEGWQAKNLNVNLKFGQHYATALEHFHKHRFAGLSIEDATIEVVHEALRDTWVHDRVPDEQWFKAQNDGVNVRECFDPECDDPICYSSVHYQGRSFGEPLPDSGAPWDSFDSIKTRETLIRTIIWYLAEFEEDVLSPITLASGAPAVEFSFKLPIEDGLIFSGHIDRLVELAGDVYVQDQKTTKSALGPYYFKQFKPNTQMSMYTFAGQVLYSAPIKGVIIDAAHIAVGFSRFERGMTFRTEDELSEWYDNTLFWIAQAQTAAIRREFPMNPSSCGDYGGCEFRNVCSMSPDVRTNFLRADFVQGKRWNPLEAR